MKARTTEEIKAEIAALKALRPVGQFAAKTLGTINAALEELQFGVDDTTEEYSEMPHHLQDIIMHARDWKEGRIEQKASEGWGELVEQQKVKARE